MDEPVGDADVHKQTKGSDARDRPIQHVALREPVRYLLLAPASQRWCRRFLREDEAIAPLIGLDHCQRQPLAIRRKRSPAPRSDTSEELVPCLRIDGHERANGQTTCHSPPRPVALRNDDSR